jgi:hypothetical protein
MGVGVASSGSGGQGFAFKLEGDGDSKIGNSSGDLHQITGSVVMNENVHFLANGRVGINTDSPAYKLGVAGNVGINEYIYHNGDADTFMRFQEDSINFQAGGADFITLTETTQDEVVINESSADIDFRVESNNATHMFFVDGASNRIGVGTSGPQHTIDIQERTGIEAVIRLQGSADVGIRLQADSDNSGENDNPYIDWYQDGQNSNSRANRLSTIAMEGDASNTFTGSIANALFISTFCPNAQSSSLRPFQIATDSSDNGFRNRFTIEGTHGFVGIGKNNPEHMLDISGSTKSNHYITTPTTQDLGTGATSTLSIDSGLIFLDADQITSADIGGGFEAHVLTIPNGSTSGQKLTIIVESTFGAGNDIPIVLAMTINGKATGALTAGSVTSLSFVYYSTAAISGWYEV